MQAIILTRTLTNSCTHSWLHQFAERLYHRSNAKRQSPFFSTVVAKCAMPPKKKAKANDSVAVDIPSTKTTRRKRAQVDKKEDSIEQEVVNVSKGRKLKPAPVQNDVKGEPTQMKANTIDVVASTIAAPQTAPAPSGDLLFSLGPLIRGALIKRPSASIKTPYVGDVSLEDGQTVLAHAPSMDCAGMVMPGATLFMTANAKKEGAATTKTSHTIQLVQDMRDQQGTAALVGYHPSLAERVAKTAVTRGLLSTMLGEHVKLESQKTFGNTRVDFVLHHKDGSRTLLEVKNVVCADFLEGTVPDGRPKVGAYCVLPPADGSPYQPCAIFPHGSHKPGIKVVSDRAIKHVHELTQIQTGALKFGPDDPPTRCAVLFVVNRSDCAAFRPCDEADTMFANILKNAQDSGVQLIAHDVTLDTSTGDVRWGKQLPVTFRDTVTGQVDEVHLQQVLEFNQNDPRKNWKSKASPAKSGGATTPKKAPAAKKAAARGGKGKRKKKADSDEDETEESEMSDAGSE